jgi:hypothetical protein
VRNAIPTAALSLLALLLGGCVDASQKVPGATDICDTRLGPLTGCGPDLGAGGIDQIRAACTKLESCGLVSVQNGGRTFDDCVGDFEQYPIDTLPAILDCIAHSSCEQLHDPDDSHKSICERFAK